MNISNYLKIINERFQNGIGLELSFDDILHYQKIIVALSETDRLMKEVDKVRVE